MILKCSTEKEIKIFLEYKLVKVSFSDFLFSDFFITIGTSKAIPVKLPNLPVFYHQLPWLVVSI